MDLKKGVWARCRCTCVGLRVYKASCWVCICMSTLPTVRMLHHTTFRNPRSWHAREVFVLETTCTRSYCALDSRDVPATRMLRAFDSDSCTSSNGMNAMTRWCNADTEEDIARKQESDHMKDAGTETQLMSVYALGRMLEVSSD